MNYNVGKLVEKNLYNIDEVEGLWLTEAAWLNVVTGLVSDSQWMIEINFYLECHLFYLVWLEHPCSLRLLRLLLPLLCLGQSVCGICFVCTSSGYVACAPGRSCMAPF